MADLIRPQSVQIQKTLKYLIAKLFLVKSDDRSYKTFLRNLQINELVIS